MTPALRDRLAKLGAVGHCLLLAVAVGVALAIVLPIVCSLSGISAIAAPLAAAVVVWIASAAALFIGELFSGPNQALMKLLFGMTIRMALPLAACMFVQLALSGGGLASAGFVFYILGFYLLALPIDTILSVVEISSKPAIQ